MSQTALVTGGGGFLGGRIVEMLLAQGVRVRVLGRGSYPDIARLGAECVRGDLRDGAAVRKAAEGVDTVYHVAAKAGVWGRRQEYFGINVTGTENVIRACRQNGVSRLVYTSSPSVVFGEESIAGGDETLPYPDRYLAHYPASKAVAEQAVLQANGPDLATCALRPHLIWGPKDNHLIPRLIEVAGQGRLIRVGDGTNKVDLTYVDNAATAHVQAAGQLSPGSAVAGQAYFIGDPEPVVLWDWIDQLLVRLGMEPVKKRIGYRTARTLGGLMEVAYRLLPLKGEPPMTRFVAAQFAKSHFFSHAKAARDFGYAPSVDNATGLDRLLEWLKQA